jgi:hypothetical protein
VRFDDGRADDVRPARPARSRSADRPRRHLDVDEPSTPEPSPPVRRASARAAEDRVRPRADRVPAPVDRPARPRSPEDRPVRDVSAFDRTPFALPGADRPVDDRPVFDAGDGPVEPAPDGGSRARYPAGYDPSRRDRYGRDRDGRRYRPAGAGDDGESSAWGTDGEWEQGGARWAPEPRESRAQRPGPVTGLFAEREQDSGRHHRPR